MDTTDAQDTRQRAGALIQETGTLLGMIPKLLDENEGLRASAEAGAREAEVLRGEIDSLRIELEHLRSERESLAGIVTRIATDTSRLGELVARPKVGGDRKSPFSRELGGAHSAAAR